MSQASLRIGIVCYPTYGGSGAVATELGRQLARRGHVIHFISYSRPFRLAGDFHENIVYHEINSEHYPLFLGQLYAISAAVKIRDIVLKENLDLLHVHYALPHAISAWMADEMLPPERRVPTLTTLHGTDITVVGSKPAFAPAVKLGLGKSNRLTCVSQWLAEETRRVFGVNGDQLHVIHNFIDPQLFSPDNRCCHHSTFERPDEHIIMHISNFRRVKRLDDVVRTFARVCDRQPARLLMVGDGPDRSLATETAEQLGVLDRVEMLGTLPCVQNFLPMADVLLFPSDKESFGLAALEAMACGVPVVGSDAGGLPEVVAHGQTGWLCPVGDIEAYSDAILRLFANPRLARTMGEAGRRRVVEKFSSEKIVPQYERLYFKMLDEAAVGGVERRT